MEPYVRRTLTYYNEKSELERVHDVDVTAFAEPVIVLGEPGMGKTRLLQRIAQLPGTTLRSAASFVEHPNPAALAANAATIVIDGLDELSAAQEADPVYRVLGQLIKAGCPRFVLSCRAADWRGAIARQDIAQDYGVAPRELALEPLTRESAIELLTEYLEASRAEAVVDYLEARGIPDLYGNPLTLRLFGEIAGQAGELPATRAELLRRACTLMWSERGDRQAKTPLANLDQESALTAAGAACAALVLTGSEAISLKPSSTADGRVVHASDLRLLPGGREVRWVVRSRLFARTPNTNDQFRPIHRSVAEYLGARWLAGVVKDDESRERALAMMTINAGVPASLRGIHAWLAHFDPNLASRVIATDPYGVLRYGDADGLSVDQGRQLLQALTRLQEENPYFRAEDWNRHSAKGIAQTELQDEIRSILVAPDANYHLRTVLLEAIRGSMVAVALAGDLRAIMLDEGTPPFTYRERHDAAEAVIELNELKVEWPAIIERLTAKGDEDSTRLALEIMDTAGYACFNDAQIAEAALAHLGLLDNGGPDEDGRSTTGTLYLVARHLPEPQIEGVLDALAARTPQSDRDAHWHARSELGDFVARLVVRRTDISDPEPLKLLSWLRITPDRHGHSDDDQQRLTAYLQGADSIRRAIQRHMLFVERDHDRPWSRMWRLGELHQALALGADDVIIFLNELARIAEPTEEQVEIWRELATFARRIDGRGEDILAAARAFAVGKAELEAHLFALTQPLPPPDWEVKAERRRRERERKRAATWAQHRKDFSENEAELRTGELRWSLPVAEAYLGRFRDVDRASSPPERIGEWLGPELQVAGLVGLESVLGRPDLPSPQQVADSYAESRRWNFVFPMIAGVAERIRQSRSLVDLRREVITIVRLALHHEPMGDRIDTEVLAGALDAELRQDVGLYERYVRLLIEPSLEKRRKHIAGLYGLVRTSSDRVLVHQLAFEWLKRYPDLPNEVEIELVDALVDANAVGALRELARERAVQGYVDDQHRRNWQAIGLLVDFEAAVAAIGTIPDSERSFLWHLRHRLGGERSRERQTPDVGPLQLSWVIRQFRTHWPRAERPSGMTSGDTNPWDATEFVESLINRLAGDPSNAAVAELAALVAAPRDEYTDSLRYAADQQRRAGREINFPGVTLEQLRAVVEHRPPQSTSDLLAIVRFALSRLQSQLRGSDTDALRKYYRDNGQPRGEDECTDRLIEDLERLLSPYRIGRVPQRDMPAEKRADIVFTIGDWSLPVECKGQWNSTVWGAANAQLDMLYLRDWRAQDRGLYIVYWFGPDVASAYKLRTPSHGIPIPSTPDALRGALTELIRPERRRSVAIEVLDLTR